MPHPSATSELRPWTALVPVRAGSKGLPGKNTRWLVDRPLYRYAIDQALAAGAQRVIVSTDIDSILEGGNDPSVVRLPRPAVLCDDSTPMAPVVLHALDALLLTGTVVLLQATSPLRRPSDIRQALALFGSGQYELVMSVTEAERGVLKWGRLDGDRFLPLGDPGHCFANRQSLPPVFRPNGAVYVFDADGFRQRGGFETDKIGVIRMSAADSLDIDNQDDFDRCALELERRHRSESP